MFFFCFFFVKRETVKKDNIGWYFVQRERCSGLILLFVHIPTNTNLLFTQNQYVAIAMVHKFRSSRPCIFCIHKPIDSFICAIAKIKKKMCSTYVMCNDVHSSLVSKHTSHSCIGHVRHTVYHMAIDRTNFPHSLDYSDTCPIHKRHSVHNQGYKRLQWRENKEKEKKTNKYFEYKFNFLLRLLVLCVWPAFYSYVLRGYQSR